MWLWLLLFQAWGLAGCGSLPQLDRSALHSAAVPASPVTALGRTAAVGQPTANSSGFRLLPLGSLSLDARQQLVKRAERSLDLQYYHLANDDTGRALLRQLRDAAARGVRVRLLLDDLYPGGCDELLLALAAHPGVEVRLFNPFTVARERGPLGRFVADPFAWGRINHRMHNKLFIADGAWAVMGGRNIADEYFLRKREDNFIDVDALVAGAVLPQLQALFDRYWNSDTVFPVQALLMHKGEPSRQRAHFEVATEPGPRPRSLDLPPKDVLGYAAIGAELDEGALQLIWGTAKAFADDPGKPQDGAAGGALMTSSVTYEVLQTLGRAQQEVTISSPYFIPGERGLALFTELRGRDVQISVLTNSLASTDELLAHLGYARYRPALLDLGVQLYELSQRRVKDNMRMFLFGASLGRLHAKTLVIDRRFSYIGSMNFDPRSATINTELGVVIDSPQLAAELLHLLDIDRLHNAYRVQRDASGDWFEWHVPDGGGGGQVLTLEPDSRWWMRWLGSALLPFTPENQL